MKSEHLGEHLVNTWVNTFLREVNTLNTLRVYTRIFKNVKRATLVILVSTYYNVIYTHARKYVYALKPRIVFTNRYKVFTKPFTNCSPDYSFLEVNNAINPI